ncbi:MAG: cobalt ECF transporter T component CbiQ [Chloroflexi bacterium]|nr:cobalt ECF transporter T component CbiQ [Chloroflexota bacterium]
MHVHFLDPYQPRSSPVHRLDARVKLTLALAFILTVSLTPSSAWPVAVLLLAFVLAAGIASRLGAGYLLRRSALALPFMLAALPVMFTLPGEPLILGGWRTAATLPGLERFAAITLKSWISVQAAILLAASTSFPDLLSAMRALRLPRLLIAIFALMWRYLFVLADEAMRLMRARAARSGEAEAAGLKAGGGLAWRAGVAGGMAGSLFLRAFERSDRIYTAMLSRGYDGEIRSLPLPPVQPAHWLALVAGLSLFSLLLFIGYFLSG